MRRAGILFCLLLLSACGREQAASPAAAGKAGGSTPLTIYAVSYPLAWAAGRLAGEAANVRFPVAEGVDPAFWQPDLETIAAYQQADLILLNGAGYAKWIANVSLPQNRLVNTSQGFAEQLIAVDAGPLHSHGPEGDHSHGELAFTVWLDLTLFGKQVSAVAEVLSWLRPEAADVIAQRRDALLQELQELDRELVAVGKQLDGAPLLYSHPVYHYLQRGYRLNGRALHWEPGEQPSKEQWAKLDALLASHPARIMLWEDEPDANTREQLQRRGIDVVVFRPMGNRPSGGDFAEILRADITNLAGAVR